MAIAWAGRLREILRQPSGGVLAEISPGRTARRPGPPLAFDLDAFGLGLLEGACNAKKPVPAGTGFSGRNVRQCPTLPRGLPRSTIGAEGLNFRVRDGTGCFPLAIAAATLWNYQPGSRPYSGNRIVDANPRLPGVHAELKYVCQALGLLVPVS